MTPSIVRVALVNAPSFIIILDLLLINFVCPFFIPFKWLLAVPGSALSFSVTAQIERALSAAHNSVAKFVISRP